MTPMHGVSILKDPTFVAVPGDILQTARFVEVCSFFSGDK